MYKQIWEEGLHSLTEDLTVIATRVHLALQSSDHSTAQQHMEAIINTIEEAGGRLHALQHLAMPSRDRIRLE